MMNQSSKPRSSNEDKSTRRDFAETIYAVCGYTSQDQWQALFLSRRKNLSAVFNVKKAFESCNAL